MGEQSDVFKLSLFNWTTLTDDVIQYTTFHKAQLPAQGCSLLVKNGHEISKKKMFRIWEVHVASLFALSVCFYLNAVVMLAVIIL